MGIIVQKFGGTSVADTDKIQRVAHRVLDTHEQGHPVVVVLSAMGKSTDSLIKMAGQLSDSPSPREVDMLMATGEQISIALMAIAIQALGHDAISFTGPQVGIVTDKAHRKAKISSITPDKIHEVFAQDKIAIVAGFQGCTVDNEITTLGRGGSDTTAVALAAALKADVCEIYTDVEGVFTTDPRIVKEARKLDKITYDEMLELASAGARVLHSRSVELAKNFNVPLHVRSTFLDKPGTFVTKEDVAMEDIIVSGVAYNRDEAKISILKVPDKPGIAARLFGALGEKHIVVDMIIQNIAKDGTNDISFTVGKDDFKEAFEITRKIADELCAEGVIVDEDIAKVSVVGVGMKSHANVAATMFKALADNNINIEMISTSEIKISCVIKLKDLDKAIQAIHNQYELAEAR